MSKSSRKSSRTSSRTRAPRTTAKLAHQATAARHWIVDRINYGPAVAAVGELATWVFDLAAADVADWPAGARRVRTARRYVMSRLEGKRRRAAPIEDVVFTAGLLARIFESELSLSMSDVVAILDELDLPTEGVPLSPRVQSPHRVPLHADVTPLRPRAAAASPAAAPCDACGGFLGFRNAA